MDAKEIITRLEIVKLATQINDHETILLQIDKLKEANSSRLNEISTLLNSKSYKQGLYLIKGYLSDMGSVELADSFDVSDDTEKVLDIEDMLRMSPLAKETIKDYKRSAYTEDDLAAFAKNIEVPPSSEYEVFESQDKKEIIEKTKVDMSKDNIQYLEEESIKETNEIDDKQEEQNSVEIINNSTNDEPVEEVSILNNKSVSENNDNIEFVENKTHKEQKENFVESLEEESKESKEIKSAIKQEMTPEEIEESKQIAKALENADSETPLDEISAEVLGSKTKDKRTKALSKYKTLRAKFGKKVPNIKNSAKTISGAVNKAKSIAANGISKQKNEEKAEELKSKLQEELTTQDTNINNKEDVEKIDKNIKSEKIQSKLSKEEQIAQDKKDRETIYSAIPNIEEKFRQAFVLFPPIKESEVWIEEVIRFLKNISKNSFTELDIKQLLDEYSFYIDKRDIAKAAQILLLASSTESKYAKFLLARELFAGKVIARDLKKSFILMKELANTFYPEAVCDLGQFYEYGIGIARDKKVAIKLYEKAFELGVTRATKHINRLKESSGLFSTIFKLK